MRTLLIGTQCYKSSLAATVPGLLRLGAAQWQAAVRGAQKVGSKWSKGFFVATVAATMFCTSARAAICEGPIAAVAVHDDGRLLVRQGTVNSPIWALCTMESVNGQVVKVSACKSWLAILLSAQKTGATVQLYTRSTPCDLANWGSADVYYVEDRG